MVCKVLFIFCLSICASCSHKIPDMKQNVLSSHESTEPGSQNSPATVRNLLETEPGSPELLEFQSTVHQLQDTVLAQNQIITELKNVLELQNKTLTDLKRDLAVNVDEILYLKGLVSICGMKSSDFSSSERSYPKEHELPIRNGSADSSVVMSDDTISNFCRHTNIAFYAYLSSLINSPERSHVIQFDVVKTNIGNAYNSTNGTFVVPRPGLYTFTWTVGLTWKTTVCTCIRINGQVYGMSFGSTPFDKFGAQMTTGTIAACVKRNDKVTIETCDNINTIGMILSDIYRTTSFAGWRIGQCEL